jgi:hypothetical protein
MLYRLVVIIGTWALITFFSGCGQLLLDSTKDGLFVCHFDTQAKLCAIFTIMNALLVR